MDFSISSRDSTTRLLEVNSNNESRIHNMKTATSIVLNMKK